MSDDISQPDSDDTEYNFRVNIEKVRLTDKDIEEISNAIIKAALERIEAQTKEGPNPTAHVRSPFDKTITIPP